jgi:uncharacterized membrane protein
MCGLQSLGYPGFFVLEKYMQQVRTHYTWLSSFRHLRTSAVIVILLVIFGLINASLLILAQTPSDAAAQDFPLTVKVEDTAARPPNSEVTVQEPAPTPTPTPTPQPTPKPVATKAAPAAVKPTPAYDKVTIPSIGLSSRYVAIGLTASNAIDVHPSFVGRWNGSAEPGTPGTVFLDGHNPGIFRKVPNIAVGAQITISKASGEVFNYTVVHTETVQLAGINMRAALSTYGGATEGLNMMTCVGTYNAQTGTTDQRHIVYAVRA